MAIELIKRSDGAPGRTALNIRGNVTLTPFDPIKDVTGKKDTVIVRGSPARYRPSVINYASGSTGALGNPAPTVIRAASTASLRGPGSARVARNLPSVPRRNYQPTVLVY